MAEPKKKGAKKSARGRPRVEKPREQITGFRGSPEFETWFWGLVEHCRIPAASVIEKGCILLAEHEGYEPPPPKR